MGNMVGAAAAAAAAALTFHSLRDLFLPCFRFERSLQLQRQHEIDEAAANEAMQRSMVEDLRRRQQVAVEFLRADIAI